jgi:outer membrane protein OmpA-like peptidoglycan-associated protein
MSKVHFDEHSIKKYTLTIFLSFAVVFCFVVLMMQWQGDFVPGEEHAAVTVAEGEHHDTHAAAAEEKHEEASKAESVKVELPGGIQIEALKGGIEDKLVAFLNDSTAKADKDVWFDFDNLNFKTGSTEITEESNVQVQNITAILKAYPKLKVKIGGYTDKTGDSTANLALSQERADAVLEALKKANASAEQLTGAEGYGSQYAKAAVDAPDEERKLDRRISLGVREK